jgi:ubiquinone/menaquinone biosynthesis C-methylase UbiE
VVEQDNALLKFTMFYVTGCEKRASFRSMFRRRTTHLAALGLLVATSAAAHDLVEEATQVAELMQLGPGTQLADVGAGDGEFGEELARRLGETGHVYLTEIGDPELTKLRKRLKKTDLTNMSLVVGETDDTMLPEACCDAMLLRYVYHHMSDRPDMCTSLRRSLRPGGLLLVIDKDERGDGVPAEELIADMSDAGFEVVSRHPDWGGHDGHYGVVFRHAGTPPSR